MNLEASQQIICHPNPDAALPQNFELPPGVQRTCEIIGSLAVGALGGCKIFFIGLPVSSIKWDGWDREHY